MDLVVVVACPAWTIVESLVSIRAQISLLWFTACPAQIAVQGFVSVRAGFPSAWAESSVSCASRTTVESFASVRPSLWLVVCAARTAESLYLPTHGSDLCGPSFARRGPPLKACICPHRPRRCGSSSARCRPSLLGCDVLARGLWQGLQAFAKKPVSPAGPHSHLSCRRRRHKNPSE